ncbi:hypothetical protein EDD99_4454 [Streptomyces sp. 846.5]|nr:hypothetical protein EDD99_4454 [Streptomyces sp. 846.5]
MLTTNVAVITKTNVAQQMVADFRERYASSDPCDIATEYVQLLPCRVMMRLLGVEGISANTLTTWSDAALELFYGWPSAEQQTRLGELVGDFYRWLADQVAWDAPADGLIGFLRGHRLSSGEPLDSSTAVAVCFLVFIAGQSTTGQLISTALLRALAAPRVWARAATEDGFAEAWVEEILRREPVVMNGLSGPSGTFNWGQKTRSKPGEGRTRWRLIGRSEPSRSLAVSTNQVAAGQWGDGCGDAPRMTVSRKVVAMVRRSLTTEFVETSQRSAAVLALSIWSPSRMIWSRRTRSIEMPWPGAGRTRRIRGSGTRSSEIHELTPSQTFWSPQVTALASDQITCDGTAAGGPGCCAIQWSVISRWSGRRSPVPTTRSSSSSSGQPIPGARPMTHCGPSRPTPPPALLPQRGDQLGLPLSA